jgi:hypothetical protein
MTPDRIKQATSRHSVDFGPKHPKSAPGVEKKDTSLVQIQLAKLSIFRGIGHNKQMKTFTQIALAVSLLSPLFALAQSGIESDKSTSLEVIHYYQNRYPLTNPYDKLVNNHGDGNENLYGVRNFRAVLNGVVYRGGANNTYNKHQKRPNQNPLPNEGLIHLCEEGFGTAVYLYTTNYKTAPKATTCKSVLKQPQTLHYIQESPHLSNAAARRVLNLIYTRLTSTTDHRPIYMHCWNGWHASGLISAYTLRQFCGYTVDQAVNYWNRNADGNNVGSAYDRLRTKIRAFKPDPDMIIDKDLQTKICPTAR